MSCYTGITGFIIPYTKKEILPQHFDQFQSNSRKYSMISYLNEQWKQQMEANYSHLNNNQIINYTHTRQDRFF
jgi:hypothetical protein